MQTGWYKLPVTETASASEAAPANNSVAGYQYYDEDGKRASDWRNIEGVEGISEEGETYRFYFKNGKPYYAERPGAVLHRLQEICVQHQG